MSFVVIIGCDGSGKSTVLENVIHKLSLEGHKVISGHWRPAPFSSTSGQHAETADDPHGRQPRGGVTSVMKLGWIWVNWWSGWFKGLRKATRNGYVFFDRYHGDLLVDPRRYRYGGPMWLAKMWSRTLPRPDYLIYLDAEVEVLLARKQEVSAEALEVSRKRYRELALGNGGYVIDVDRGVDEIVAEVLLLISINK